jgi:hypothetical protein
MWDGETVAWSEDVNARGLLDRLAASIELDPGAHLVAVKVCSSPLPDEGRVRIRFTDEAARPSPSRPRATSPTCRRIAPWARHCRRPSRPRRRPLRRPALQQSRRPRLLPRRRLPRRRRRRRALPPRSRRRSAPSPSRRCSSSRSRRWSLQRPRPGRRRRAHVCRRGRYALASRPRLARPRREEPAASPDQLALCGWLSAFGANKSGWLNLALEKGLASGDKRSASFAQRRLVESLLTGGALDSTLRLISKAPLSEENDVAARVLRAGIIGRTRSQLDALNALIAIDDELKQKIPTATLRELVSFSSARPELKPAFQRRLAQISLSGRDASFAAGALNDGNAAYERAVAQVVPHVSSARRVVTYHPDKRVSQLMHYAREVVIEPRTEQDLYENVPAEGDDTELLVARVHRKDGTVAAPEEQSAAGGGPTCAGKS